MQQRSAKKIKEVRLSTVPILNVLRSFGIRQNSFVGRLLRLGEKHEHTRAAISLQLKLLLFRPVRNGKPITVLIIDGLTIDQDHVMVSLVALEVVKGYVPRIENTVSMQRNFLPMIE